MVAYTLRSINLTGAKMFELICRVLLFTFLSAGMLVTVVAFFEASVSNGFENLKQKYGYACAVCIVVSVECLVFSGFVRDVVQLLKWFGYANGSINPDVT